MLLILTVTVVLSRVNNVTVVFVIQFEGKRVENMVFLMKISVL